MRSNMLFAGITLCSIFLFSACSKSSQQKNPVAPATVYIAAQGEGSNAGHIAKYWKDTAQVILSDNTQSEEIFGIYVSGNDVYLAGTESSTGTPNASYWKNGVKTLMNEPNSGASGIAVSGSDVYISGGIKNDANGKIYPVYWKNGVAVTLQTDSTQNTYTSGIAVSGNDVYVSGYENKTDPITATRNLARYWKNGIAVTLSDTAYTAGANAIFVSGNDVYVAGFEAAQNALTIATFWKNGVPVSLTDGSVGAVLTGIYVSGSDVYICGNVNGPGNGNPVATYWKNRTMISLKGSNQQFSLASGITVFQNDVYVSGNEDAFPKYWKNGTMVDISSSSFGDQAMGIFVAPK